MSRAVVLQVADLGSALVLPALYPQPDYATLVTTEQFWGPSSFKMTIGGAARDADALVIGSLLWLPDDGDLVFFIEHVETVKSGASRANSQLTVAGRSVDGFAGAARVVIPDPGDDYDEQVTVASETAMKHYVRSHAGVDAAAARQIPSLVVAADQGRPTDSVSVQARYQMLGDVLVSLGLTSGLGWQTTIDPATGTIIWEVISPTDRSASVFLDFDFGTVSSWTDVQSALESSTVAVVGGQGDLAARDIETRWPTGAEPAGLDRREAFVDARDVEPGNVALLDARGDAFLEAAAPVRSADAEIYQHGSFQPGVDFFLGDIVLLHDPDAGVNESARVVKLTKTWADSAAAPTIEVAVGKPFPGVDTLDVAAGSVDTSVGGGGVTQQDVDDSIALAAVDLSAGGANMVPNSDFESAVAGSWTVGAEWTCPYTSGGFHGTNSARVQLAAQTAGDLVSAAFIAVARADDWWVSYWSYLSAYTSGTARFSVREYDAASALLATTDVDLVAAETDWTRHALHFGPDATTPGRIAWQATTTKIKLAWLTPAAATLTWQADAAQVERGKIITAYAPSPQELKDGQVTGVQLADLSVSITKFASGIVPPRVVAALPNLPDADFPFLSTVLLTSDKKLYRNEGNPGSHPAASTWSRAVDGADLVADSVLTAAIAAGAVTADEIAANTITAAKIAAHTITAAEIAALTITAAEIAGTTITAAKIAANTITAGQIAAHTITAAEIAALTITAAEIAAGAVTAAKIEVGVLTGRNLLVNGGFRAGTTGWNYNAGAPGSFSVWTTNAAWTLHDGDVDNWEPVAGPYGSSGLVYVPAYGTPTYWTVWQRVPVVAGQAYSLSGLLGNHGFSSYVVMELKWLYADLSQIGSTLASNIFGSPPYGGPEIGGWGLALIENAVAPSGARYASIHFTAVGTSPGTYMFMDQAWFGVGKVAQPFTPGESDRTYAADGKVIIDSTGITIKDAYGATSLGSTGFAGAWLRYLATRAYNSDFVLGDTTDIAVTETGGADTVAEYAASLTSHLPYWVVAASDGFLAKVADATATGGFALRSYPTVAGQVNRWYQDIPCVALSGVAFLVNQRYTVNSGSLTRTFYASYRDATHALIGARVAIDTVASDATTVAAYQAFLFYGTLLGDAPANAAYVRFEIEITHNTTTNQDYYVSDVIAYPQDVFARFVEADDIVADGDLYVGGEVGIGPSCNLKEQATDLLKTDDALWVAGHAPGEYRNTPANTTVVNTDTYYAVAGAEVSFTPIYVGQRFLILLQWNPYADKTGQMRGNLRVTTAADATILDLAISSNPNCGAVSERQNVGGSYVWTADRTAACKAKAYVSHSQSGTVMSHGLVVVQVYPLP